MPSNRFPSSRDIEARASRVGRDGKFFFQVGAAGFVRASLEQTWSVLTDYERLPDFVPDLVSAHVLAREGNRVTMEQFNRAGFLFVSQLVRMVVRVDEQPMSAMDVTMLEGDMQHYSARWELEPASYGETQGTRIRFGGTLEPRFYLPPFVGNPIMQANVRQTVEAVVAEIERRHVGGTRH